MTAVPEVTLAAFKNEMLKFNFKHFENETLKIELSKTAAHSRRTGFLYISKHFAQCFAGPSANPFNVATPPRSPPGAGNGGTFAEYNGFTLQITPKPVSLALACNADASQ